MGVPPFIHSLSQIASRYDAAICDVWGVVHNGVEPYPESIAAMRRFRSECGPVVLLSNAPRLADGVRAQFDRLSIAHDFYDGIVTSGSVARDDLIRRIKARGGALPLFYLGPPRDNPVFHGLELRFVAEGEAELVFCTGLFDDDHEKPEHYLALLERFRARALPFLCANPDIVVQRGNRLVYCAGAIARLYDAMGGETVYFGKPHAYAFRRAADVARKHGTASRPLVIGDGIETDIGGANRAGLDALFVAGGIHAGENSDSLAKLFRDNHVHAVAAMRELIW